MRPIGELEDPRVYCAFETHLSNKGHQLSKVLGLLVWVQVEYLSDAVVVIPLLQELFLISSRIPFDEVLQLRQVRSEKYPPPHFAVFGIIGLWQRKRGLLVAATQAQREKSRRALVSSRGRCDRRSHRERASGSARLAFCALILIPPASTSSTTISTPVKSSHSSNPCTCASFQYIRGKHYPNRRLDRGLNVANLRASAPVDISEQANGNRESL